MRRAAAAAALARRPQRSLVFGAALVAVALTAALTIPSLGRPPANTVVALDGSRVTLRPAPADAAGDVISMRAAGCDLDFVRRPSDHRHVSAQILAAAGVSTLGRSHQLDK